MELIVEETFEQMVIRLFKENLGNKITPSLANGLLSEIIPKHNKEQGKGDDNERI